MPFDFSLVAAPFRMQPGLRRVAAGAAQLTPNDAGSRHLREKVAVLGSFAAQALLSLPSVDEAALMRTVAAEAARTCPDAFRIDSIGDTVRIDAARLGWALENGVPHGDGDAAIGLVLAALPLALRTKALLSLAFAEDFALLDGA